VNVWLLRTSARPELFPICTSARPERTPDPDVAPT